MTFYARMERLLQKIGEQCREIDRKSIEQFIDLILNAKRIFVHGVGRSGMVSRAFAMRLMHLGFTVYVVGETTTPAIREGDILIAVTGSGRTSSVYNIVRTTKEKGGIKIATVTSYTDSPVGKLADVIINIKGRLQLEANRDYGTRQISGDHEPLTPLGTLFELSTMVFFDSLVEEIMRRQNKSEAHMKMFHTDLE